MADKARADKVRYHAEFDPETRKVISEQWDVDFELVHPKWGTFHDALHYTGEEWAALHGDPGAIEAEQLRRLDAYVDKIENPEPAPPAEPVDPAVATADAMREAAAAFTKVAEALSANGDGA